MWVFFFIFEFQLQKKKQIRKIKYNVLSYITYRIYFEFWKCKKIVSVFIWAKTLN